MSAREICIFTFLEAAFAFGIRRHCRDRELCPDPLMIRASVLLIVEFVQGPCLLEHDTGRHPRRDLLHELEAIGFHEATFQETAQARIVFILRIRQLLQQIAVRSVVVADIMTVEVSDDDRRDRIAYHVPVIAVDGRQQVIQHVTAGTILGVARNDVGCTEQERLTGLSDPEAHTEHAPLGGERLTDLSISRIAEDIEPIRVHDQTNARLLLVPNMRAFANTQRDTFRGAHRFAIAGHILDLHEPD